MPIKLHIDSDDFAGYKNVANCGAGLTSVPVTAGSSCLSLAYIANMTSQEWSTANPNVNCLSLSVGQQVCITTKAVTTHAMSDTSEYFRILSNHPSHH